MNARSKTDKNDAFMLEELLCFNPLKGIYAPRWMLEKCGTCPGIQSP